MNQKSLSSLSSHTSRHFAQYCGQDGAESMLKHQEANTVQEGWAKGEKAATGDGLSGLLPGL